MFKFVGLALALLSGLLLFGALAFGDERDDCGAALEGGYSFASIQRGTLLMAGYGGGKTNAGIQITEQDAKKFWLEAWPYLVELAAEHDSVPSEFLSEYLEMMKLFWEESGRFPQYRNSILEFLAAVPSFAHELESLAPGSKLKARQWRTVENLMGSIMGMAYFAVALESAWRPTSTINPFKKVSAEQIELIFESLETSKLDHVATVVERARAPKAKPVPKWLADVGQRTSGAVASSWEPPLEEKAAAFVPTEPVVGTTVDTSSLAAVLKSGSKIENRTYEVVSGSGETLTVTFSGEVVEDANAPETQWTVRRLLRALLIGRGTKSGLKRMFDLGPRIIELKAVMHGHKRLIGCLDNGQLYIRRLIDIGASRATYSRRIPADFCAE